MLIIGQNTIQCHTALCEFYAILVHNPCIQKVHAGLEPTKSYACIYFLYTGLPPFRRTSNPQIPTSKLKEIVIHRQVLTHFLLGLDQLREACAAPGNRTPLRGLAGKLLLVVWAWIEWIEAIIYSLDSFLIPLGIKNFGLELKCTELGMAIFFHNLAEDTIPLYMWACFLDFKK